VVVGVAYGLLAVKTRLFGAEGTAFILFFLGLLPVRVGEWLLLLRLAFGQCSRHKAIAARAVGYGILVSYALDAIGIMAAFVLPGGMWVC
jgi:hypothetical protein